MTEPSQRIQFVDVDRLTPSPENSTIYRAVDTAEHSTQALAISMRDNGVREPLVVTRDHYVVSGHRRLAAAKLAGIETVPARRINRLRSSWTHDEYVRLLVEQNVNQRHKNNSELLREQVALVDPKKAHADLRRRRLRRLRPQHEIARMVIRKATRRDGISAAKQPMLEACQQVIAEQRDYWPLSVRQIHYRLLNSPPPLHASKGTVYSNNDASYQALVKLLTQARHAGIVPHHVIGDGTRPVTTYNTHADVQSYFAAQLDEILTGYFRDLLQTQPSHIELLVEKMTLSSIVEPVASEFCVPLTISRGQCSTSPLYEMAQRYKRSGKSKLIVLLMSDLDPDGVAISDSVASRLRYDFHIPNVEAVKVALMPAQVSELNLPPNAERAKTTSTNYRRYIETLGNDRVYELEAVEPSALAGLLKTAIEGVLDLGAYNREVTAERADAADIAAVRERVLDVLKH